MIAGGPESNRQTRCVASGKPRNMGASTGVENAKVSDIKKRINPKLWFRVLRKRLEKGDFDILLTVNGESMSPTLTDGSRVKVRGASRINGGIKVGDVIVFCRFDTHATIHRVVQVMQTEVGTAYRTKGDNNGYVDRYVVNEDEIVGIVIDTKWDEADQR